MNIEQLETAKLKIKAEKTLELDNIIKKINTESKYQVVGRYRGTDIDDDERIYGYTLERLVLAPKDNLDEIFLTKFAYNNLFKLMKAGGWCIFNPLTDFTLTRGEQA